MTGSYLMVPFTFKPMIFFIGNISKSFLALMQLLNRRRNLYCVDSNYTARLHKGGNTTKPHVFPIPQLAIIPKLIEAVTVLRQINCNNSSDSY